MADYDLNGVHVYNKFVWSELVRKGIMNPADYPRIIPIVPTQQDPVLNDLTTGKPYIVYTYLIAGYDANIWANVEQVTYRIFSDNERQLRQISNFLVDLSKRMDWTADDINTWITVNTDYRKDADDAKFDFKFVQVVGSTSPEPANTEGGRQFSTVTVRMTYVHSENGRVVGGDLGLRS